MAQTPLQAAKVGQIVPLLGVADMAASLRFYVDGLGAEITKRWEPEGVFRWAWLTIGEAALMIQEPPPASQVGPGSGWSLCLMCGDAIGLWREARARGLEPKRPFVGNGLWVTELVDPDGYRLEFESPTDVAEETEYDPALHG